MFPPAHERRTGKKKRAGTVTAREALAVLPETYALRPFHVPCVRRDTLSAYCNLLHRAIHPSALLVQSLQTVTNTR